MQGPYMPQGQPAPSPMKPQMPAPPMPNVPSGAQPGMSWDTADPSNQSRWGNQPSLGDKREGAKAKIRDLQAQLSRAQAMGASPMAMAQLKQELDWAMQDYQESMSIERAKMMGRGMGSTTVGVNGLGGRGDPNLGAQLQLFDAMYGGGF